MEKLTDIVKTAVKTAGFEVMDLYENRSSFTAYNEEMDLYNDVLLFQQKEILFCSERFSVSNLIAALLLVNELNESTESGKWFVTGDGKERCIVFSCQIHLEKCDYWESLLRKFSENYMSVKRALRLFHEKPLSGKTLAYCATLRSEEDEIPEEELSRIRHIQILYEKGQLQEEDITPQDVMYLEKLFCRDCMEIRRGASKFKYRAYWSLRNATKNKRKLDML